VNNDFLNDPALLQDFLVESEELLQGMDQDMVSLESSPEDAELLNRIFRAMHTIKGTSGFLGFDPIVNLSHHAEDVLNGLRRGDYRLNQRMMDVLLSARDQLGCMLSDVRNQKFGEYPLEDLLHELELVQKPPDGASQLGQMLVDDRVIQPETLQAALAEQSASEQPKKLGEILVEKGAASAAQVGDALVRQRLAAETQSDTQTMRVDVRKLDELINLVGELVLERNRLVRLSHDLLIGALDQTTFEASLGQSTARLSFITEELQIAGLKTRMVPIESVFRKFPRLVRDVSRTLDKQVKLVLEGQQTEIDKTMVELICDPLVHLVRNSLDHGVESPEVREKAGKPREGTIRLEASQEGDQVVITIEDDGAGINPELILAIAIENVDLSAPGARDLAVQLHVAALDCNGRQFDLAAGRIVVGGDGVARCGRELVQPIGGQRQPVGLEHGRRQRCPRLIRSIQSLDRGRITAADGDCLIRHTTLDGAAYIEVLGRDKNFPGGDDVRCRVPEWRPAAWDWPKPPHH